MTSPAEWLYVPATVPALVGRQYVQKLSTRERVTLPAPATVSGVSAAHRTSSRATLPAPTADSLVTSVLLPDWHIDVRVTLPAPVVRPEASRVGYRVSSAARLPAPQARAINTHREFLVFETPAQTDDFQFARGSDLWGYFLNGLSVYRAMGEWHVDYVPDRDLIDGLEVLYRGGHRHRITQAEADELSAAGFSDYIRTEVS